MVWNCCSFWEKNLLWCFFITMVLSMSGTIWNGITESFMSLLQTKQNGIFPKRLSFMNQMTSYFFFAWMDFILYDLCLIGIGGLPSVFYIQILLLNMSIFFCGMRTSELKIFIHEGLSYFFFMPNCAGLLFHSLWCSMWNILYNLSLILCNIRIPLVFRCIMTFIVFITSSSPSMVFESYKVTC